MDKNPDWSFTLIGDGPLSDQLINYSKKFKCASRIIFIGYVENKDLEKYFKESSYLIMSSKREGVANVIMEAFIYNLPVVAFNFCNNLKIMGKMKIIEIIDSKLDFNKQLSKIISSPSVKKNKIDEFIKRHNDPKFNVIKNMFIKNNKFKI